MICTESIVHARFPHDYLFIESEGKFTLSGLSLVIELCIDLVSGVNVRLYEWKKSFLL